MLATLGLCAFAAILTVYQIPKGWLGMMVGSSSAGVAPPHSGEHFQPFGINAHLFAVIASITFALVGITVAWWLHLAGRTSAATSRADKLLPMLGPIPKWAQHKWYVDELYDWTIVKPLRVLSHIFHLFDKLLVDGLVNLAGLLPRGAGHMVRKQQTGVLHDYAVSMAAGIALVLLVVILFKGGVV